MCAGRWPFPTLVDSMDRLDLDIEMHVNVKNALVAVWHCHSSHSHLLPTSFCVSIQLAGDLHA